MNKVKAFLFKTDTDDGLMGVKTELGTEYTIDLDTIEPVRAYHIETHQLHMKYMVYADARGEYGAGYMPIELLEWEGKENTKYATQSGVDSKKTCI